MEIVPYYNIFINDKLEFEDVKERTYETVV